MANDLTANPWKLDTAATIYSFPVRIGTIIWGNYTTTGDALILRDINGKDIVNALITTSLTPTTTWSINSWVRGLVLNTITHGEVTITIGAGK